MLEIPMNPSLSADQFFSVILDNVICEFRLIWNSKTKYWMINSYFEPETEVKVYGLKIIPNYPFLHTYKPSFSGQILALNIGKETVPEITYNNFGEAWKLIYLLKEEFSVWSELHGF